MCRLPSAAQLRRTRLYRPTSWRSRPRSTITYLCISSIPWSRSASAISSNRAPFRAEPGSASLADTGFHLNLRSSSLQSDCCRVDTPARNDLADEFWRTRVSAPHRYTVAMQKDWKTKLIHSDASTPEGFRSLTTPVYRGSTTVFPNAESVQDHWNQHEVGYTYGLYGTPTTLELAGRVCELEHGYRTIITPGGQSALTLINLAILKAGDHVLIPESIYGPHRELAKD